jgi:transcriptional regulator GlxA family with amidase domain
MGLTPLGARVLLGLPAAELASIDVDARDVLGRFETEMRERVARAGSWAERFAVLDRMLLSRAGSGRELQREVAGAWGMLTAGRQTSIGALARATGWSRRHLGERFRAELGLSPKAAARLVRFDRARRLLQRRAVAGEQLALADLAVACGYYDQAHLARDFRDLAGCAPSRWLAEELPNVQAGADWAMAESMA